jgi:integrase-like protein
MEKSSTFKTEAEALAIPAPVKKTHIEHWHASDSCFGMRIMRARARDGKTTRRWLARYYEGGRDFRINLGAVGRLTWDKARLAALTKRVDVQSRRELGIVPPTFSEAYRKYTGGKRQRRWSPDTRADYAKKYELLEPFIGDMRVDQITSADVQRTYDGIESRISRGIPKPGAKARKKSRWQTGASSAVAALNLAKTVLNTQKFLKENPFEELQDEGVFQRREPRTSQVTSVQLPIFWRWLHQDAHPAVRDLLLCTLCMSLRASVAGSLSWDNLVEDQGRYAYLMHPDQRGNKTRLIAPVPVPSLIVERVILPRWESPTKHKTWIIESPKKSGHPLKSIRGSLMRLKKDTKIDITLHDLRRTITSAVVRTSDLTTARRVLTHSLTAFEDRLATTGNYFVNDYDDMRRAMNRAVKYIKMRAEPREHNRPSDVPELDPAALEIEHGVVDAAAEEELLQEILAIEGADD